MSTDQTPALARATEAVATGTTRLHRQLAASQARAAVSAALHDPGDDVIARTLRGHGEVVVHSRLGCRCGWRLPPGWMGVDGARDAQSRHVADAVRAAILGADQ